MIKVLQPDPNYEKLAAHIAADQVKFSEYRVNDGQILKYVKCPSRQNEPRFAWKQFPGPEMRQEVIKEIHDKAHLGFEKTLASIKERYIWPKMNEQVRRYYRECFRCQTSKAGNINVTPPMGSQKPVVTIDFVGSLPASGKNRCTCLLVATDVFSKFILVQPFREAKAGPLTEFVENMIFNLFGVPEILLTDNGTQFISKTFKELLQNYHVNHWLTLAYHPQVNNTERVNRVITTAIRATLKKAHKHWADDIKTIPNAIRMAVHESAKYTPYFVVFGRNQISDGREYARIRDHHTPEEITESEVKRKREEL